MIRLLLLRLRARQLRYAIDSIRGNLAEAEAAERQFREQLRRVQAQISMAELDRRYARDA
jgi:hypothetical protein